MTFGVLPAPFIDINGWRCEEMHAMLAGILSTPAAGNARAMVAQARAPMADLNGRDPAAVIAELAKSKKGDNH